MKKILTLILVAALMFAFAIAADAAVGTVVYGYKVDKAPNLEEIDESWGEPAIYVTKDSPNAQPYKFWDEYEDTAGYEHGGTGPNGRTTIQPEPSDFWLYVCYTDKNLYIGIKSPDVEFSGSETVHRGDGVHMWLEPLENVDDPTASNGASADATDEYKEMLSSMYSYYWNVAFDDYSVDKMFACLNLDEPPIINWVDEEYMHAILEIPLQNYGLRNKNLHGYEFAISVRRVSSKSYYDEGYAGWLQWGPGIKKYTPLPYSLNTIVLVDPAQGEIVVSTEPIVVEPVETEAPATEVPTSGPAAQIGDTQYDTFAEAVAAVKDEEKIVLLRDANEEDVVVHREVWFFIDGAGFGYPSLIAGEGLTMSASGSPLQEYLGVYHFEGNVPATEAPATEAPATEAPATEAPATEAPATEAPATEAPATEAPATEAPATEAPATEAPATEAPATEAPATEAPATEAPATEAPATEAPATEAPATEAPATEAPATEAPKAEKPAEKNNTGLIIGIVAAVVVVGAIVGIVLGKKKK